MNKTAIKNFSIWARNKLIADISYRAGLMGITEVGIADPLPQSTDMTEFYDIGTADPYTISGLEVKQRKDLVDAIHRKEADSDYETAYKYIIEEVAFTWFNRLIAVRFMEVNDYLPSHIRVLSAESGKMEPDLVTTPFDANLEFTAEEEERIINLKRENALDEMFRLLFVKQCNALNSILPGLFEKTGDYTELLLNLSVTDKDGVVYHLVHDIDESDFDIETKDESENAVGQVEIIGWLYQYYNTEPKEETFALLKKNIKVTKERIPSVTQLFTPDWIVRYMVENSLGRLWVEGHPDNDLKASWKYYLDEVEQEPKVEAQLLEIRKEHASLNPEDIKVIDPCMGSGHILIYVFDVLMQIYENQGYTKQDAVKNILENNLYGLDIDERAAQLAYFAVMMKARSYDRRFFTRNIRPHIYAIQESNGLSRKWLSVHEQMQPLFEHMKDAKEYGSIIEIPVLDYDALRNAIKKSFYEIKQLDFDMDELQRQFPELLSLIDVATILSRQYDVVVTNPPYMGASNMSSKLNKFVKSFYPDSKSDMSTICMEKSLCMCNKNGYMAMINIPVWMFLSSYEKLRMKLFGENTLINMVHPGRGIFGSDFGTTTFVFLKAHIDNYIGTYYRLFDQQGEVKSPEEREKTFLMHKGYYTAQQSNFFKIPGLPVAYWVSYAFINVFKNGISIDEISDFTGSQNKTANNEVFLRQIWEVKSTKIGKGKKWVFYSKGGEYRKHYGNLELVVNWSESARNFYKTNPTSNLLAEKYWYQEGITYTMLTSKGTSFRYMPPDCIFDMGGPAICYLGNNIYYILALLNSKIASVYLNLLNPTINLQAKDIKALPIIFNESKRSVIEKIEDSNIHSVKKDWDSFETSWDFENHPFVRWSKEIWDGTSIAATMDYYYGYLPQVHSPLELCWLLWQGESNDRFEKLKNNEEELNRIFIEIYGLQDELSPEEEDKDVTVRKADLQRDIRSFLSYAVGCMFGRYSLDMDGLAYAGGDWDDSKYTSFQPDADDIIPITDEEYLEDDIVVRLCQWLKVVYGEETLEENLDFIAQALGNKGDSSREVIRNYFLKDFFTDHCKIYQKRPIYWLFDSGKQDGFKALVYLHRYTLNTIGDLRIDYLHRMQRIYDGEISRMQDTIDHSDNSREITKATKRMEKLQKQLKECQEYDEKISHLALSRIELDLDDGVKVNYEKVQTAQDGKKYQVLAKI